MPEPQPQGYVNRQARRLVGKIPMGPPEGGGPPFQRSALSSAAGATRELSDSSAAGAIRELPGSSAADSDSSAADSDSDDEVLPVPCMRMIRSCKRRLGSILALSGEARVKNLDIFIIDIKKEMEDLAEAGLPPASKSSTEEFLKLVYQQAVEARLDPQSNHQNPRTRASRHR